ncbi:MAG: S-ribosylhomocysteine lyase [Alphaproteobacteria bacterium ADurb.Bin438]|nr:MAG: S-ribosylhomocysteine lyase [Alphaproteobacteria bacterium ADurb.Bin438]
MPLLDSFKVDHTKMGAPSVRIAKLMQTKSGDDITIYDLRFCRPNHDMLPEKGLHTLEHLFAGFMRDFLNNDKIEIIDISPMGCKTGFYMSVIGKPIEEDVKNAFLKSMMEIAKLDDDAEIPASNELQCGSCALHSMVEAKQIATNIVKQGISINKNKDLELKI